MDFETDVLRFEFEFSVSDLGTPPKKSSIILSFELKDVNDNYPTFSLETFQCSVEEGGSPDLSCGVDATDGDINSNNDFDYSITEGSKGLFEIDQATGILTATGTLDREMQALYIMQVKAVDKEYPRLSSTALVFVTVTDKPDIVPMFDSLSEIDIIEGFRGEQNTYNSKTITVLLFLNEIQENTLLQD